MKLAYVVSQWRRPTETFVRREIDAARAAGHDVVVLSLKPPVEVVDGDPVVVSVSPRQLPFRLLRGPVRWSRLLRTLGLVLRWSRPGTVARHAYAALAGAVAAADLGRPEWVHAHFAWLSSTAAVAAADQLGTPFGVMPHAHDIYEARVLDRYLGVKLRRAALVVVESPRIAADVADRFGCAAVVLRMGVPAAFLREERSGFDPRTVLSVGTLHPKKGHDTLIRAVALLPDVCLTIVGGGNLGPSLRDLAETLGVADRVTLAGPRSVEEVVDFMDAHAVFCLASRITPEGDRDGVPNVLIEAMARSVPVVATQVSGIPDLLGADRGLLVPPDDPEALARALQDLLDDSAAASAQAGRAFAHVAADYTAERNWQQLEELIRQRS